MGMSDDFEVAVEEGATHVRVGTALFGRRSIPGLSPSPAAVHEGWNGLAPPIATRRPAVGGRIELPGPIRRLAGYPGRHPGAAAFMLR